MNRFSKLAAALAVLPVLAVAGHALADSPPQLGGGADVYVVKNLTKGGSFASIVNANACEELKYSIRLHNTAFSAFQDVKVSVDLPGNSSTTNTSTATATTNLGGNSGTSDTATVDLSSAQTIGYENGTAILFDANGNVIRTLPDTITSSGVDIGPLNGSTTEFVEFKAKVSCPTTPPATPPTTPATTTLPNTGAGDVLEIFAGVSALGAAGHYATRRFKR
jgi:hypothetical protein